MNYFLHINTALENAYVAISQDDKVIVEYENSVQKEHGGFLHPAIKAGLANCQISISDLAAVSVIAGPGSYTGLRVGLAAAKGICFGAGIPLVDISTTAWMMASVLQEDAVRFYPVIDARRDEVFTALYDKKGNELLPPFTHIVREGSFSAELEKHLTLFFGNGARKCQAIIRNHNALFMEKNPAGSKEQASMTVRRYLDKNFANLAYSEPLYVKDFYTAAKRKT